MDQRDLNEIASVIGSLYEFADGQPRDRRVFVEQAGVGGVLRRLDLSGSPPVVAADIVQRLATFGFLRDQPQVHALGSLLGYTLTISDLPRDCARFLAGQIIKYSLVNDSRYLAKLHHEYISDAPGPKCFTLRGSPVIKQSELSKEPSFQVAGLDHEGLESVINTEDNFLDIYSLDCAVYCARAVCRIECPAGEFIGTGILIGPDLIMTNHHVLPKRECLDDGIARFDYKIEASGIASSGRCFKFRHDVYAFSTAEELDYLTLRLEDEPLKHMCVDEATANLPMSDLLRAGRHKGYLPLVARFIKARDRLNIIQHPGGDPLKIVMTQNYVVADMTARRVHYVADTKCGSSGSPVFNRNWEVVALHHSGQPYPANSMVDSGKLTWKGQYRVNEGIPTRAILEDFRRRGLSELLPRS